MTDGYKSKREPDVSWWIQQVHQGIKYRKYNTHQAKWDNWRRYYQGRWNDTTMPVNLFFKMARTVVPRIYFRNPGISISPSKPGMLNWAFAQLLERVDNKMLRQMGVKKKIKRVVGNTWFFGTGVTKIGYGALYNLNMQKHGHREPIQQNGSTVEHNADVIENMPWMGSTHPGNFIVPDGQIDFEDSPWVTEWIRRPLDEVVADKRFKNTKNMKAAGSSTRGNKPDLTNEYRNTNSRDMVDLLEIHDMRTGMVMVLAPYMTDRVLFHGEDDLQYHGICNYKPMVFNEQDNCFWGVPDSQIIEPDQLEINEVRTMQMIHWRLSVMKLIYQRGKVDDAELQKIVDGEILSAIGVKGDVRAAIDIIQAGEIPDSLFKADMQINQDVRESVGFSRNEFGETSPSSARTTAFETRVVKMASEIRVDERRDMVADMLLESVNHINSIIFSHWTSEQVIQVAGPMGVPLWVRYTPAMLKEGSYDVKVDLDNSLPETKDIRTQRAIQTYTMLKDNPMIDPIRLTRYFLHEMHGVQFDDMMRGMPPGLGGPTQPLDLQQFIQLTTQVAQRAPQALVQQAVAEQVDNPKEAA